MEDPDATIIHEALNVDDILRKYGIKTKPASALTSSNLREKEETQSKRTKMQVYDLSDSDNESISPLRECGTNKSDYFDALLTKPIIPHVQLQKRRASKSPSTSKTAQIAEERAQRKLEVEMKKIESLKNKEIKRVLSDANKHLKPDECIKFVTIILDETIANNKETILCTSLKDLGCDYKIQSQIVPHSVTWTRQSKIHLMDDETGVLKSVTNIEEVPDLLLILSAQDLFNYISDKQLVAHIKCIQSIYVHKYVSLGVVGLDKQLKQLRRGNNLTYKDVMGALTELQIFCNCCYRNLNCDADLAALLCQFTKAIAQKPYKLQQQEKYMLTNWYMKGDNKDCVKVDKRGNGLNRLWQQQLTSFPLARLEIAESIIEKYPTVKSLMKAYENSMEKEKGNLLADINVRRHAGPITSSRRIGNEMSKKIYKFYNSLDGDVVLS